MTQLTEKQFQKIEPLLPKVRGSKRISQIDFINAILYVVENGCKWRRLPKEFGPWHTVYMRMRRWAESGVLLRVFRALREEFRIEVERYFRRLKSYRRIFTRYDKLDTMFLAFIQLAAIYELLKIT